MQKVLKKMNLKWMMIMVWIIMRLMEKVVTTTVVMMVKLRFNHSILQAISVIFV